VAPYLGLTAAQSRLAAVSRGKRTVTGLALLAALLGGCGDTAEPAPEQHPLTAQERAAAKPEGSGNAKCSGVAIAYVGTIIGENAAFGRNIHDGVEFALRQHNEANPDCQVELVDLNTEGDPRKAPGIVAGMVAREEIVGVIGLPFADESGAAGPILAKAGLVQITPSATNPELAQRGWRTFFRGTANDRVQAAAAAELLTGELKKRKVCVVNDGSAYARGLSDAVVSKLGEKVACTQRVLPGHREFAATASKIAKREPDAVYFAGFYPEAGRLAAELAKANVDATFVGSDGVLDQEFVKAAGDGARSAHFVCACVPAERFADFSARYTRTVLREPGAYSVEAYDATTVLLAGIDDGNHDRKSLLRFVGRYNAAGLSRRLNWKRNGELSQPTAWVYRVSNGKIVPDREVR
jgi:branched-chain amino acid transport system substrate-binding protein